MPPSERTAFVWMPARSEPVPGSVIAMDSMMSPETQPGTQRRFCSSVPKCRRYGRMMLACVMAVPTVAPARATSSANTAPKW